MSQTSSSPSNLMTVDSITQFVNGTQAAWNTITIPIPIGLVVYATDTTVVKMGDGVTLYANLPVLFTISQIITLQQDVTLLQAIPKDTTNLLLYTADPTGVADSGGAFTRAFAAIPGNFGRIFVPRGTYLLGEAINQPVGKSVEVQFDDGANITGPGYLGVDRVQSVQGAYQTMVNSGGWFGFNPVFQDIKNLAFDSQYLFNTPQNSLSMRVGWDRRYTNNLIYGKRHTGIDMAEQRIYSWPTLYDNSSGWGLWETLTSSTLDEDTAARAGLSASMELSETDIVNNMKEAGWTWQSGVGNSVQGMCIDPWGQNGDYGGHILYTYGAVGSYDGNVGGLNQRWFSYPAVFSTGAWAPITGTLIINGLSLSITAGATSTVVAAAINAAKIPTVQAAVQSWGGVVSRLVIFSVAPADLGTLTLSGTVLASIGITPNTYTTLRGAYAVVIGSGAPVAIGSQFLLNGATITIAGTGSSADVITAITTAALPGIVADTNANGALIITCWITDQPNGLILANVASSNTLAALGLLPGVYLPPTPPKAYATAYSDQTSPTCATTDEIALTATDLLGNTHGPIFITLNDGSGLGGVSNVARSIVNAIAAAGFLAPSFTAFSPSLELNLANAIRNFTGAGAIGGTPGTLPTDWTFIDTTSSLTCTVAGTFVDSGSGRSFVRITISGTPPVVGNFTLFFDTANILTNLQLNATISCGVYAALQAGSMTGIPRGIQFFSPIFDVNGGVIVDTEPTLTNMNATLTFFSKTDTIPNAGIAPYHQNNFGLIGYYSGGTAINLTLDLALPLQVVTSLTQLGVLAATPLAGNGQPVSNAVIAVQAVGTGSNQGLQIRNVAGGTLKLSNASGTPLDTLGIAPGTYQPGGYSAGSQTVFMVAEDALAPGGRGVFIGGASNATDVTVYPHTPFETRGNFLHGLRLDRATYNDNNALLLSSTQAIAWGTTEQTQHRLTVSNSILTFDGSTVLQWSVGPVTMLAGGLSLSSGALTSEWFAGSVATVGSGLSLTSSVLTSEWSAGAVTNLGSGLATVTTTVNSVVTTTLNAEWNVGPVTTLAGGLSLSAGVLSSEWNAGIISTVGSGLSGNAGILVAEWSAGAVTNLGSGLATVTTTVNSVVTTTLNAEWSAGAVATLGSGLSIPTGTQTLNAEWRVGAVTGLNASLVLNPTTFTLSAIGSLIGAPRIFTGTSTYTPTAGTNQILIEMMGGGGAGGNSSAVTTSGQVSVASGGSSGGYLLGWITGVSGSYAYVVGAGGTNGGNGESTTFGTGTLGVPGGIGGATATATATNGLGGGTAPELSSTFTSTGLNPLLSIMAGQAGGTTIIFDAATNNALSGSGGSTVLGLGGSVAGFGLNSFGVYVGSIGVAAAGYGAGGGGATNSYNDTAAHTGGAGANGTLRIWEFT